MFGIAFLCNCSCQPIACAWWLHPVAARAKSLGCICTPTGSSHWIGLVAWTKISSSEALVRMPFAVNPKLLQLMLLGPHFKFLPPLLSHVGFDLLLHLVCSFPVLGPPCDIECEPKVCSAAPGLRHQI